MKKLLRFSTITDCYRKKAILLKTHKFSNERLKILLLDFQLDSQTDAWSLHCVVLNAIQ